MNKIEMHKKYRYRNGEPARVLCVDLVGEKCVVSAFGVDVFRHLANGR
jgi:hypothetical protein